MKKRTKEILDRLDAAYGTEELCFLSYETPWQLLFSTILSAQCTDKRVNELAKTLYATYPTLESFAKASLPAMEEAVRPTGFYHNKAKNLIACAGELLTRFHGEVPRAMEDLTSLPGVGRKTANLIRGHVYHEPGVVVDTHVKRIAKKLGLTKETAPERVERDLMKELPKDHWLLINRQLITLGRSICTARSPKCGQCFLRDLCHAHAAK